MHYKNFNIIAEKIDPENLPLMRKSIRFDCDGDGVMDMVFWSPTKTGRMGQFIYYLNDDKPLIVPVISHGSISYTRGIYLDGGKKILTREEIQELQRRIAAEKREYLMKSQAN